MFMEEGKYDEELLYKFFEMFKERLNFIDFQEVNMIEKQNKKNKSLVELAISDTNSLTEEQKANLRNWLDGIVKFVNEAVKPKKVNIYDGGKYGLV